MVQVVSMIQGEVPMGGSGATFDVDQLLDNLTGFGWDRGGDPHDPDSCMPMDSSDEESDGEDSGDEAGINDNLRGRDPECPDPSAEARARVSKSSILSMIPLFRLFAINLSGAFTAAKFLALKRYFNGLSRDCLPHAIACQDPAVLQVFRGIVEYYFCYSATGTFTEEDMSARQRKATRGKSAKRGARQAADANTSQPEDTNADANSSQPEGSNVEPQKAQMYKTCWYIRKDIPRSAWEVEDVATGPNKGLVSTLKLKLPSGLLSIHNVYNHLDRIDIDDLMAHVGSRGNRMLVGDFNFHHPDWSGPRRGQRTPAGDYFASAVKTAKLELVTEPGTTTFSNSRDTSKRSSTLDLTFASKRVRPLVQSCEVKEAVGFQSDHRIIETVLQLDVPQEIKMRRCWEKVNQRKFRSTLRSHLPDKNSPKGTQDQRNSYIAQVDEAVRKTIELCVPLKRCGPQPKPPSKLDLEFYRLRAKAEDLVNKSQIPGNEDLGTQADQLVAEIRRLEQKMWRRSTSERSKTKRGAHALAALGKKMSQPQEPCQVPPLFHKQIMRTTPEEKFEAIEESLFRSNKDENSKLVPDEPEDRPSDGRPKLSISWDLSDEELRLIIKGLAKGKAPGPGEIPNEAIQLGGDDLRCCLLPLFRVCLEKADHPKAFKDSILIMLRKAGKPPHLPNSWRPISLLSCLGKILEKIVALRMVAALGQRPDLLPPTQFGGRTTTEALQYLLDIIYSAWTESKVVTLLGLDMSGAYDNVEREKLLQILVDSSLPDWIIGFVRSFLSDRSASIHFPGITSPRISLKTGIPQADPAWPVYAQPTGRGDQSRCSLLFFCRRYILDRRVRQLRATRLDIKFGPEKYDLMHFRQPRARNKEKGGDRRVVPKIGNFDKKPEEGSLRILGVHFDPQLKWTAHIDKIRTKVNRTLGHLNRISGSTWGPSLQAMRQFYLSKIRSLFTYACGAWFIRGRRGSPKLCWGLTDEQIHQIDSLQHHCLRQLSGAFFRTSGIVLEKEMYVENLSTVLYTQATLHRAKVLISGGWTVKNSKANCPLKKSDQKTPYYELNNDTSRVLVAAILELREKCATDKDKEAAQHRWADKKKRNRIIKSHVKRMATKDCEQLWEEHFLERTMARALNTDNDTPVLPAALTERWGMQSFRTEIIGLNYHLSKISPRDSPKSPLCPCGTAPETPFHLFVQCSRHREQRRLLQAAVNHTSYAELMTKDADAATQWAIAYFGIEEFNEARENVSLFPPSPETVSQPSNL
ncbi:hypothetical protein FDECE_8864 [Fusarium decemcellulare]|nr:hypothetical protein FDECE_8864 [Fusarium decemcellulare]